MAIYSRSISFVSFTNFLSCNNRELSCQISIGILYVIILTNTDFAFNIMLSITYKILDLYYNIFSNTVALVLFSLGISVSDWIYMYLTSHAHVAV